MWCVNCDKEVATDTCPDCNMKTQDDIPVEVYFCPECNVPVIRELNSKVKEVCPLCKGKTKYLSKDLRPVFPQERLLFELMKYKPGDLINDSVWCNNAMYYINGKSKSLSSTDMKKSDPQKLRDLLQKHKIDNSVEIFNQYKSKFIQANKERLEKLKTEAYQFINEARKGYTDQQLIVSFSGGKDSTVVSDLVIKALGNPQVYHIFGNTTLEFPLTIEYKDRFRKENPMTVMREAKNREKDFYEACHEIGPPSRVMRWCCTMFKTGPITRTVNSMARRSNVLTFYGIRKSESASRSKYDRIYDSPKIMKQKVASPIFNWKDIDIWLYLLGEDVDFNDAYRLGFDRVGCWCCPNNSERSHFLAKLYMPDESKKWRDFLIGFAKAIGKPDAEEYVDSGNWKARQGGYGVAAAKDVKINNSACTADENAQIYELFRPLEEEQFYNLFVPFGRVSKGLGRKLLKEVLILDKNNVPIISIQPYKNNTSDNLVKIQTMNVKNHEELQRKISYQLRKYNACRKCLGCESVCKFRAITVNELGYKIDENKCVKCGMCITDKYLRGGCLMSKYLFSANEGEKNEV
ncbi:phosphoadenosine phosphosulfate reductase family protein [Proteinivorax tanatarense]|uniref:Phosphoadenosine phosphosulfate reductase family protein n=1 Tax=Proteinivorax tanatarense TaxID=1260629 RepID=A0AAU7VPQ0_9FIRM